jgi:hypothetical protein
LAASLTAGCYQPIVSGGELRPDALETVLERAERARGIRSTSPADVRVVTSAQLSEVVQRTMMSGWDDGEIARYEESLVTVGLWPRGRRVADEITAMMSTEAIGLYGPEERALYVVSDPSIPMRVRFASAVAGRDFVREYALAHEIVHMLQHEAYPGLFAAILQIRDSDDASWAAQAAIEGDAVRYGFAAMTESLPPPPARDFAASLAAAADNGPMAEHPRLIREGVVFPYARGYALATLEAELLLANPPASTEQALHASKRGEPFTALVLSQRPLPSGCERLWTNSVGELGFSILLRDHGASPDAGAWNGWDGDRYLAARCNGAREFMWLTTWDSESDAAEFADAYRAVAAEVAVEAGLMGTPVVEADGRDVLVYTPALAAYAREERGAAVRNRVTTLAEAFGSASLAQPAAALTPGSVPKR